MVMHTFLFQWEPHATPADKERAAKKIRGFQDVIPGLIESSYNANISPRSQGFTHGGIMKFESASALQDYFVNPVHQELVDWLMPLLSAAAELDYEV